MKKTFLELVGLMMPMLMQDTQQFLQSFQQQNAGRGAPCNRQDAVLQERVALQVRRRTRWNSPVSFCQPTRSLKPRRFPPAAPRRSL